VNTETADDTKQPGTELLAPLPDVRPPNERPSTFLANVDTCVSVLWPEKDWRANLDAITNKSSITGKWEIDRGFAAKRVQEEAAKAKMMDVATARLTKVMRAIETILRRDKLGRRQRLAALLATQAEAAQPAE
jgi:hypothetical protein